MIEDIQKFMAAAYSKPDEIAGGYFEKVGWLKIGYAAFGTTNISGLAGVFFGFYVARVQRHEARTGKVSNKIKPSINENHIFTSKEALAKHLAEEKARYERMGRREGEE